jgi:CHASE2 domain-containing sensor protein
VDARVRGRPARLLVICVTALAVAWAIGGTGLVDAIEQRVDYLAAKIEGHDAAAAQVVLVEITPADFADAKLFAGRRPLDPGVLKRVIERIAAQQPAVIGVDIDTAPAPFEALRDLPAQPAVVWARPARVADGAIELFPVLGFSSVEAEGGRSDVGVALSIQDEDGIVRSYRRRLGTAHDGQPSFACAILERCAPGSACAARLPEDVRACRNGEIDREWLIDYREKSHHAWKETALSAGELLAASPDVMRETGALLRGKIVLLGGSYPESGDLDHPTPLDDHSGIELVAQVLATELRGGGANPGSTAATSLLITFETYLILLVLAAPSWRRRLAGAALVVIGLAVVCSLFNERDLSRTGHFTLVLLLVLVLQAGVRYVEHSQEMLVEWWRGDGREKVSRRV